MGFTMRPGCGRRALLGLAAAACCLLLALASACGPVENFGPHDATPTIAPNLVSPALSFGDAGGHWEAVIIFLALNGKEACRWTAENQFDGTYIIRACLNRPGEDRYVWRYHQETRALEALSPEAEALTGSQAGSQ